MNALALPRAYGRFFNKPHLSARCTWALTKRALRTHIDPYTYIQKYKQKTISIHSAVIGLELIFESRIVVIFHEILIFSSYRTSTYKIKKIKSQSSTPCCLWWQRVCNGGIKDLMSHHNSGRRTNKVGNIRPESIHFIAAAALSVSIVLSHIKYYMHLLRGTSNFLYSHTTGGTKCEDKIWPLKETACGTTTYNYRLRTCVAALMTANWCFCYSLQIMHRQVSWYEQLLPDVWCSNPQVSSPAKLEVSFTATLC